MTPVPTRDAPPRRVDGSMSLLVDMMTNSLDSSYAEAAARKRSGGPGEPRDEQPGGTPPSRRAVAVLLLIALGLVTGTAAAQVRRRQASLEGLRAELVSDVRSRTAATDDLAETAAVLRRDVDRLQDAGLSAGAAGRAAAEQLAALELAAGIGPVRGPGIVVRLNDAPGTVDPDVDVRGGTAGEGRVLDRDMQDVVNALWAAGAEAISVNGLRLTVQTAIRSAGEAILVDYRPLSPPYTIRAIGDPKQLEPRFVDGEVGRRLGTYTSLYGLEFAVRRSDGQTLPGSGAPTLRLAQPAPRP